MNKDKKILNYRIAKNGSSAISNIFLNGIFGQAKNKNNYIHLENIDFNLNEYFKFIVLRDTKTRIESQIHHCLNTDGVWWFGNKFSPVYRQFITHKNILYLLTLWQKLLFKYHYTISDYDIDDDVHIIPQTIQMRKYVKYGIDKIVKLSDIEKFFKEVLNIPYTYISLYGINKKFKLISDDENKQIQDIVINEQNFIQRYSNIIWRP